ncbi:unnamed protein product [Rotaria magnacalcarata]
MRRITKVGHNLELLPDELLIAIFAYLHPVERLWSFGQLNSRFSNILYEVGVGINVQTSQQAVTLPHCIYPLLPLHVVSVQLRILCPLLDLIAFSNVRSLTLSNLTLQQLATVNSKYMPYLMRLSATTSAGSNSLIQNVVTDQFPALRIVHLPLSRWPDCRTMCNVIRSLAIGECLLMDFRRLLCSLPNLRCLETNTKVDNESESQCVEVNSSRQLTPDEVVHTGDAHLLDQKSRKILGTHCDVNVEKHSDKHNSNDESLDSLILKNFVRFSGEPNVIQWLDDVENKFNSFYIDHQIRFEAIPLLIEGAARQQYIRNRKNIHSFDDFYEFLLMQFECLDNVESANNNQLNKNTSVNDRTRVNQKTVLNNSNESIVNDSNKNSRINQTSVINSETTANLETTNTIGDVPVNKTIVTSNGLFTSVIDETVNDLRRAIIDNLIKNPKIFKGGKDNVGCGCGCE